MRHHIFYSRLSVSKSIFMFPYVIILLLFLWRPPRVVEALGNCPVCRPLNPALPQQPAGDIDRLLHGAPQRRGTTPLPVVSIRSSWSHRLVTSCVQNTLTPNNNNLAMFFCWFYPTTFTANLHVTVWIINALNLSPESILVTLFHKTHKASYHYCGRLLQSSARDHVNIL